jgi:hypothetical protein
MEALQEIAYIQNLRFVSFDITNMYTNIPTHDFMTIISEICQNNQRDINIRDDIIKLTKTIANQNYFQFRNENYVQTKGLGMGAPTSAILSEIYMPFLQNNVLNNILKTNNIKSYFRYVDYIFIIYNTKESNIIEILNEFNQITPKLKYHDRGRNRGQTKYFRHNHPKRTTPYND